MTPRERVISAVKGLPVDRVPVMYWLNPHVATRMLATYRRSKNVAWNGFARLAWRQFKKKKSRLPEDVRNGLPLLLQVHANSEYTLELGADMANTPFGTLDFWGKLYRENGRLRARDAFGCIRGMGGVYLEVLKPAVGSIDGLRNLALPDVSDPDHYAFIRKFRLRHPEACIFADNFGVQDLPSTQIWDMAGFMMAMIDYPEEVKRFQRRFADWNIEIARRSVAAGADIIFIYDDYGYTNRPLISMDMWLEFTYPQLKRQVDAVHEMGALVMLHSCGYQMPFLEHYVEIGVDILQTFQPGAGNDFRKAYGEYGDRLAFATGIDIQRGESMTPEELKDDILGAYRTGGRKGRHILGMTHMLQYTMPEKNLKTLFRTVREIQAGVHG